MAITTSDHDSEMEREFQKPGAIQFIPKPTDTELAEQYRDRLTKALETVNAIVTEARRKHDLQLIYQNGADGAGIERITNLQVMKRL